MLRKNINHPMILTASWVAMPPLVVRNQPIQPINYAIPSAKK